VEFDTLFVGDLNLFGVVWNANSELSELNSVV
jgi:hypothetical protein